MEQPLFPDRVVFWTIILTSIIVVGVMYGASTSYHILSQHVRETVVVIPTVTAEALEFNYQKGLGYMNTGRWQEAKVELELVFEVDPNYKDVQTKLVEIYTKIAELKPSLTPIPVSGEVVYLSDLNELASGNLHGGLSKDKTYWSANLVIAGQLFQKGLSTHPVNENGVRGFVEYDLKGEFKKFYATIGHADPKGATCVGTMNYYIVVDGKEVQTDNFPKPPNTVDLEIDLSYARTLSLEIDNGGNGNWCDHAAWGNARVAK